MRRCTQSSDVFRHACNVTVPTFRLNLDFFKLSKQVSFAILAQDHFIPRCENLESPPQRWLFRWERPLRRRGEKVDENGWSSAVPSRA